MQTRVKNNFSRPTWVRWRQQTEPYQRHAGQDCSKRKGDVALAVDRPINFNIDPACYGSIARFNKWNKAVSTSLARRPDSNQVSIDHEDIPRLRAAIPSRRSDGTQNRATNSWHSSAVGEDTPCSQYLQRVQNNVRKIRTILDSPRQFSFRAVEATSKEEYDSMKIRFIKQRRISSSLTAFPGTMSDNDDPNARSEKYPGPATKRNTNAISDSSVGCVMNETVAQNVDSVELALSPFSCWECECCHSALVGINEHPNGDNIIHEVDVYAKESPYRSPVYSYFDIRTAAVTQKTKKNNSFLTINSFFARKYVQFRNQFRSKSSPPPALKRLQTPDIKVLDENMNKRCSICNEKYSECEGDDDSNWDSLLACSCKSKSMLDVDRLSLLVHPAPSPLSTHSNFSCQCDECVQNMTHSNLSPKTISCNPSPTNYVTETGEAMWCDDDSYCDECAKAANAYSSLKTGNKTTCDMYVSPRLLDIGELKKYGAMTRKQSIRRQPRANTPRNGSHKKRTTKRPHGNDKHPGRRMPNRWYDSLALCFHCVMQRDHGGSSSSGGSGSDGDGDEDGGDADDQYEEHGAAVSDGEDSDGGDSGSGSGAEPSMNSAELFDDQLNAFDAKDNNNQEGSDGGDGPGTGCSDSLTELGSDESEEESDSSGDEDDSDENANGEDGSDVSWQSIIIYERE